MRTSCLLLVGLGGAVISLSTPGCGGKVTDEETRNYWEGGVPTGTPGSGGSSSGTTTGTGGASGGDNTGGSGGDNTGGSGAGGDPDPTGGTTGGGGATGGSGGSGTGGSTGGSGGSGTGGSGTGGGSGGNPGGSGGAGGGGPIVDASPGCPATQPMNNSTCDQTAICMYGATTCACAMGGGTGGNRRDAGMSWTCGGTTMDAGRRG